ncbi:MAG TPA: phosphate signaling complex protein PhoU [Longimicrobium sp.]|nr:phosphate signaling complex protein PhoU [Longimicrobium sp.]
MNGPGGMRHFHDELEALKSRLLDMSSLAEELVRDAVEALEQGDVEKAGTVRARDRDLDGIELEIDDASVHLLALQQPMARDLRLITMIMRISNDLERVGDHATNLAEAVEDLAELPAMEPLPEIGEMARHAREMLSDALDDFVRGDAKAAREVCARDDQVDALYRSVFRILLTHMMEDPRRIGASMKLFMVAENLERIADLATNIAEDAVYLVEGRTIKHRADQRAG